MQAGALALRLSALDRQRAQRPLPRKAPSGAERKLRGGTLNIVSQPASNMAVKHRLKADQFRMNSLIRDDLQQVG